MEEQEKYGDSVEVVSELISDGQLFDSKGYTVIKVTKGGKEKSIKLPIKSTGVAEFQEELSGKAPRPPKTFERIKKNSDQGRTMGLKHDQMMVVYDNTDDEYVESLEKHNQYFLWQVAIFALDVSWKKKDGSIADTYEEKREILQTNGITSHHINKIYKDVSLLTQFEEDRQDFLSENT